MYRLFFILFLWNIVYTVSAQEINPIFRYPDVSQNHIVFSFANDLWLVDKNGGLATRLSSPPGPESWPKFSPDGKSIAYGANYDGASNIYTISIEGGLPEQLTHHGMSERVIEWFPDGASILYASSKYSGKQRFSQFYKQAITGGISEKLPIAHAEWGSISPDGKKVAFTDKTRVFRTWKRYRGGTATDIFIFDLEANESERLMTDAFNDELPMWSGNKIYYLSDKGTNSRFNIWVYDLSSKRHRQVTSFTEWDIHFPSMGPEELVFEAGGDLYLLSLEDESVRKVEVRIVSDFDEKRPRYVKTANDISHSFLSPDGNRVAIAARGEIYSVPAEKGAVMNLTQTSGVAERYPAWSPDGKHIAFWSDRDGEYDLYLRYQSDGSLEKIASFKEGFRYSLYWSPDSKKIAWIDQALQIQYIDIAKGKVSDVMKQQSMMHYTLENFSMNWSPDSRWLSFYHQREDKLSGIGIFDTEKEHFHHVSGGLYDLSDPVFSADGKYLFATVKNHFSPIYSGFDNSFVYTNNTQLAAFVLQKETASPLAPKNDEVKMDDSKKEENSEDTSSKSKKSKKDISPEKDSDKEKKEELKVQIDFEGLAARMVIVSEKPGNYGALSSAEGKLLYLHYPNRGESNGKTGLKYYDIEAREYKTVIEDISSYQLSADGKKILVAKAGKYAVVSVGENQKMDKSIDFSGLRLMLNPVEEWKQIFTDAWRLQRDFFYDKGMHGVDWNAVREQYGKLLDRACTREDVNYLIGEMIAELDASHAYRGGGDDIETRRSENIGYLGIDWEQEGEHFKIAKIIRAADWDVETRSPLAEPGVKIQEGDYILAVNGMMLSQFDNPYAAFKGLAGATIELTTNSRPSMDGATKSYVETMRSELRLRNLAWIEANRRYVEEKSGGRIGYVYVPSTGMDGQLELVRMFYGQFTKDALIVDERFNNGGQIPDRFIEILDRKPLAFWKTRDGQDWQWPPVAHFGPKAMLINGWSGSGGDAFPDYFRQSGLGPLIGTRTWGGLIGISGAPSLIDGGYMSVPTFRMFYPDGEWFPEGYGVDPDIEVLEDYTALARGIDPQIDKAIEYLLEQLESNPFVQPEAPAMEDRSRKE
jgi:tricorn protease